MAKINVDVPDGLFQEIKIEAAIKGKTLRELVIQALEARPEKSKRVTAAIQAMRPRPAGADDRHGRPRSSRRHEGVETARMDGRRT